MTGGKLNKYMFFRENYQCGSPEQRDGNQGRKISSAVNFEKL